jgi:hypothetical protein
MDESVLWVVALGIGGLGLLLLAAAGIAAVYLNAGRDSAGDVASTEKPQPRAKDVASTEEAQTHAEGVASTDKSRVRAGSSSAKPETAAGGFWAWVKAGIFAFVHAGTVSLVLGGVTLFEDLAKASDEIQRTGTVTFPKQLLPGTLSGPASRKRLAGSSGGLLRNGHNQSEGQRNRANEDHVEAEDLDPPSGPQSDAAGWEVVDQPQRQVT